MSLTQRISDDMKAAMKSGNKLRLETLRMLRAQIIEFEKKGLDRPMNDDDEMSILISATKKRKEAIEMYTGAGRTELAEKETKEMEIISEYLPKQLSREDAEKIVAGLILQAGASSVKDMGKLMPLAMKELKGKIDSKVISEIVKQKLISVS
ncbi:MAG TPA: GatB/YqeY domain-containing protein [Bacteroidota bacterium]|nr:GatB/YqeY domain-containing protein [Bacteroidota bacterium]